MNTVKEWTTTDKSTWGDGPWQSEPDKVVWIDETTDLDCMVRRSPTSGALCGYVGVPASHPYYGNHYDDVDVDVHGGLTFADKCYPGSDPVLNICHVPEPGRTDDVWWLGFDCAHAFDIAPKHEAYYRDRGMPPVPWPYEGGGYKTLAYVRAEVESLAAQLDAVKP